MKQPFIYRTWFIQLLLFVVSFCIYTFYFQHLAFHLNTVLFTIEGDSLKNYYTFVYHIRNDDTALNFTGMNFPFGEHVVYTDCQPLITFVLRLFPFTHNYLIGIMHGLILLSFIITPLVLFRIFLLLDTEKTPAFFFSLAIALLSPQIHRIGGHFALAYGCIIPLVILLILKYIKSKSRSLLIFMLVYNTALFLIHPYLGLGASFFCFISLIVYHVLTFNRSLFLKAFGKAFLIGVLPVILFRLFMILSDKVTDRPTEPYGPDIMAGAANMESVFTPFFGPFVHFLKSFIKSEHVEWETWCYIGFFPLILLLLALLCSPFYFKKISIRKDLAALIITGILFLFFSFGIHILLLRRFHIEFQALNQFRVLGRFAWYFYFILPVFLTVLLTQVCKLMANERSAKFIVLAISLLFFSFNLLEANYVFESITTNNFAARNIFNESALSDNEKEVLHTIREKPVQALLPFPVFHIGGEVYQRNGEKSIAPAMMYSYHAKLPIVSVMLSRTSLHETEEELELLNVYKSHRRIFSLISDQSLLVIRSDSTLKEDELRILKKLSPFRAFSNYTFYYAGKKDFELSAPEKDKFRILNRDKDDTMKNVLFIPSENRTPFTEAKINQYEKIAETDSTTFYPGNYVVSFNYHMTGKKFRYIHTNLIVEKFNKSSSTWEYFTSVRSTCGFYGNMIVFEQNIKLERGYGYKFLLKGESEESYHISDFLLKPEELDLKIISGSKPSYNNYPD